MQFHTKMGKGWTGWWPCVPKGYIYLTFWCLLDLNICLSMKQSVNKAHRVLYFKKEKPQKTLFSHPLQLCCNPNFYLDYLRRKWTTNFSLLHFCPFPRARWARLLPQNEVLLQCRISVYSRGFSCFCSLWKGTLQNGFWRFMKTCTAWRLKGSLITFSFWSFLCLTMCPYTVISKTI